MPDFGLVKVVICPDSFTGTLSAAEAADAIASGWASHAPADELVLRPLSDGGPGFIDAVAAARAGSRHSLTVTGPLGDPILAEYLVTKGVPFRTSHQIVGRMVGLCEERNLGMLKKLRVEDFNAVCKEYNAGEPVGEDIFEWLGPENVVKRYQSAGNAGVSGFEAQLKAWKERLDE